MKFIVINPEQLQSVVKAATAMKNRKTKAKQPLPENSRQKDHAVLTSNRYPNKKKK